VCIQTLLGMLMGVRMLWGILSDASLFGDTWHLSLELGLTAVTSTAIWLLLRW
jgi:low affinity Fe/Cu permease